MVTHDPKSAGYAQRSLHLDKGQVVDQPLAIAV
jgi:ABC-type lipoprotein export system ATPase subunit